MLCGWEGNRRSGVTLAMRHRLSGMSTCGLNGLEKRDEHPAYAPLKYYTASLPVPLTRVSHGSSPHGLFHIFKNNIKD